MKDIITFESIPEHYDTDTYIVIHRKLSQKFNDIKIESIIIDALNSNINTNNFFNNGYGRKG